MDWWFKDLAHVAQKQVSELQHKGSQLTERLATIGLSSKKDCEFEEGSLGFELEGNLVIAVEAGGQAERLSVEVGDRLVEVAGYKVPKVTPGDVDSEEQANRKIRKWLKEMPRPCRLTFKPPKLDEALGLGDAQEAAAAAAAAGAAAEAAVEAAAGAAGGETSEAWPRAGAADGCQGEGVTIGAEAAAVRTEDVATEAVAGELTVVEAEATAALLEEAASPSLQPVELRLPPEVLEQSSASATTPLAGGWQPPPAKASNEELRKLLEQTRTALDGECRKSAKLLDQLAALRTRSKDLPQLEEEVARLRGLLASLGEAEGEAARLRPELRAAQDRAEVAEERLRGSQAAAAMLQ